MASQTSLVLRSVKDVLGFLFGVAFLAFNHSCEVVGQDIGIMLPRV